MNESTKDNNNQNSCNEQVDLLVVGSSSTNDNSNDNNSATATASFVCTNHDNQNDEKEEDHEEEDLLYKQLRTEALTVAQQEPQLKTLLRRTVLAPVVQSFEDAVICTVCYRLLLHPCSKSTNYNNNNNNDDDDDNPQKPIFCPNSLQALIRQACLSPELELGSTMSEAIREDAMAVCRRDPAMDTLLQVVLFSKGYAALVCKRAAYRLWKSSTTTTTSNKFTALFLQSQASAVFGLDLHPCAQMGKAIMLDHGTGIVIGETAVVGEGSTLLHGVTLGGTGKERGDRHPKVGKHVLIGAGSSILGNIKIGDGAKIGAGSIVLRDIPAGATAVGAPARVIGKAKEEDPGSDMDGLLENVNMLHTSPSMLKFPSSSSDSATISVSTRGDMSDRRNGGGGTNNSWSMCPFRAYERLADLAPPCSFTIRTMRSMLASAGCTAAEIGNAFFDMDKSNVGHVSMEEARGRFVSVVTRNTKLTSQQAEALWCSYSAKLSSKQQQKVVAQKQCAPACSIL